MELTLFVDHQCNLRCSYCYTGEKFDRAMSPETMRRAVALALAVPTQHLDVSFFGGEPLIRLDFLRETIEHVERTVAELPEPRPSLRFILNTNATLIDDAAIELMKDRCFTVFVSLDGPKEVHDRHRLNVVGKGSFDRTLAGIARLREAGIAFQLMLVFGPDTGRRLGDALALALGLGATRVQLSANYRADWTDADIDELRLGLDEAGDAWMRVFRDGGVTPVEPLHSKILSHLKGGIPCPSRCLLGDRELTVAPSGRLYPCPQMVGEDDDETLSIGHLDRGLDRDKIAALGRQKDRSLDTCSSCDLYARCQSQCGCRHVALTGELGRITATLCEIEAAYIDAADRVAETLHGEGASAFDDYYYRRNWAPAPGAQLVPLRLSR
jgi:uncharacterized protein